ncbi:MAG: hypothetical protein AMJ91_06065 [candidate division Zixibacteria bacterium SM23_73_3]|nr:MAG: hypothetical protein AMJ91_06065 [candidate division Zixibacteria bacterium SM23_73_3]
MLTEENKICVYLIGEKDSTLVKDQLPGLESIFNRKIKVDKLEMDLNFAYHPRREQYHSSAILEKLKTMKSKECERLLAIVGVDLYVPELNFVFGEADFQTKVAVVSITRLGQEFYGLPENKLLFLERVKKEVVHELGHTYGLPHCPDPGCVMHFSNSLRDTDLKSYFFCVNCKKKLKLKDR